MKKFWVALDGSIVEVPSDKDYISFVMERPYAFGLSQDDVNFYTETPKDGDLDDAMKDRILALGCGGLMSTDDQHSSKDMPMIMLEITEENVVHRNKPGLLTICFWRESYPMNDRMVSFLRRKQNGTEGITKDMDVLMVEWKSQRKWTQTVNSFLVGYQFADDPSKGVRCIRCGESISRDELVSKTQCPRCALMLA